jgi:acyl-CoA thioesterase YciA
MKKSMNLVTKKNCDGQRYRHSRKFIWGILMAWLDEAAAAYATEYCCTPNMVTIRVGELIFKKPLKAGQHIRIYAMVSELGNTSITLKMEAYRFSLYSGEETLACSTNMTFVRIDDDGSPTPIGESVKRKHEEKSKILV